KLSSTSGTDDLAGLPGRLFNAVVRTDSFGDFKDLSPEQVVSLIISVGQAVQRITSKLDLPANVPFVHDVVSKLIDFHGALVDCAKKFYRNPVAVGGKDITASDGKLSADAAFAVAVEGHDPVLVVVPKDRTQDNKGINDLFADINDAINAAGGGSLL